MSFMQLKVTCSLFHCLFSKRVNMISFSLWKGVWKGVLVHNLCIKCGTNKTINSKKRFLLTWVSISSVLDWCADSWEKSRSTPRMTNISSDVLQKCLPLTVSHGSQPSYGNQIQMQMQLLWSTHSQQWQSYPWPQQQPCRWPLRQPCWRAWARWRRCSPPLPSPDGDDDGNDGDDGWRWQWWR